MSETEVKTDEQIEKTNYEPVGFGGWLYLVVFGVLISFGYSFFYIVDQFLPIYYGEQWELMSTPGSIFYQPSLKTLLIAEFFMNLFMVIYLPLTMGLAFFGKKLFPKLMIGFYVINIVFATTDLYFANLVPEIHKELITETSQNITRAVVVGLVWILYFLRSKRVKNTFIK